VTKESPTDSPTLRELVPEQALRRLELTIVRRLDGLLQGDHLGLVPGPGSELAESREYRPGEDDVRQMDWNVTARTTVPHVRQAVADRELETWVLVDMTASMDFGTVRMEKRDLAVAMTAAVGFLTERTGNRVGAQLLNSGRIRRFPARNGRAALLGLLRSLLATPREGALGHAGPDLAAAIEVLHRTTRRRGLAVVVSDFLGGLPAGDGAAARPPSWERPLRRLAARDQVLAVEIVDPRELELPNVGMLSVVDPETGRRRGVPTASRKFRERYAKAAAGQRAAIHDAVRRAGAGHLVLRTDRDWLRDIARFVAGQHRAVHRVAAPAPLQPGGG
jgi:uncharacterized protein (DUF58 family)